MTDKQQLTKELTAAGASQAEVRQLVPIAANLSLLKASKPKRAFTFAQPLSFAAAGLVMGMFLVIVSQAALPTSWLYPVQKLSDSVAIDVHSQYRATIMMKRAQQVNQLVANHASANEVLAALADYTNEASAYKTMPHASYSAFEYCKSNLQQASAAASPSVRQAISGSLDSLKTT
jgi:hypothetical protein